MSSHKPLHCSASASPLLLPLSRGGHLQPRVEDVISSSALAMIMLCCFPGKLRCTFSVCGLYCKLNGTVTEWHCN